jgi:hypothetical protein
LGLGLRSGPGLGGLDRNWLGCWLGRVNSGREGIIELLVGWLEDHVDIGVLSSGKGDRSWYDGILRGVGRIGFADQPVEVVPRDQRDIPRLKGGDLIFERGTTKFGRVVRQKGGAKSGQGTFVELVLPALEIKGAEPLVFRRDGLVGGILEELSLVRGKCHDVVCPLVGLRAFAGFVPVGFQLKLKLEANAIHKYCVGSEEQSLGYVFFLLCAWHCH